MDISIRHILFPTDFSEPAREAQQYATSLAEHFNAELHVLHVLPPVIPVADETFSWVGPENETQKHVEEVDRQLAKEFDWEWSEKHEIDRTVVVGFAFDEIVNYAKEHDIDLIVIGTHGYTGLYHLLIGSMAEKIVRFANRPVLTVHSQGHQFLVKSAAEQAAATNS